MNPGCTPEHNDKTRQMMDELEKLKAKHHEVVRAVNREKALNAKAAQHEETLRTGKVPEKVKRQPIEYPESVKKAQLKADRLARQVDEIIAKGERLNMSPAKKLLDIRTNLQMAMILASKTVYEHLGFAVVGGHLGSLISDVSRTVAKSIVPGVRGVAEGAPRYGQGLSWQALKDRYGKKGFLNSPRQAWNQAWHGAADREMGGSARRTTDEFYSHLGTLADAIKTPGFLNKVMETTRAVSGKIGGTHAATKEFLAQPEFAETVGRETRYLERSMKKNGATDEQVAEFMSRESTQATIAAKGVANAYSEKMQGKNIFNSAVDRWVGALEKSDSLAANLMAGVFKQIEPIRKIGMNIADRQVSNMFGGIRAGLAAWRNKGKLTPELRDYIMFNVGRQGVGLTLLAVGALYYTKFGGVPGVFSKKEGAPVKDENGNPIIPGESDMLPASAFHGSEFGLLQIGASMMQVYQKEYGKEHGAELALDVLGRPTWNWFERTIPYTNTARITDNTLAYGRGHGKYGNPWWEVLGNNLRSLVVPSFLQQKAREDDPYKKYRTPRNLSDDIKLGIPGYREEVHKR